MSEKRETMTGVRRRLGAWVNQAADAGERFVVTSRCEPRAAIVGLEDLRRLRERSAAPSAQQEHLADSLAAADLARERIRCWQETHGIEPEESVDTLHRLRNYV